MTNNDSSPIYMNNNQTNDNVVINTDNLTENHDIFSSMKKIMEEATNIFELITPQTDIMSSQLTYLGDSLHEMSQQLFSGFHSEISNILEPLISSLQDSVGDIPEQISDALVTMGNYGWFFDKEMPLTFLWEIENQLQNGEIDEVDELLLQYFQQNIEIIHTRITTNFPHRKNIIDSAFAAHLRGEYELSIPVFLAQTDGICFEIANQNYFIRIKGKRRPKTAIFVDSLNSNKFKLALFTQLTHIFPISASISERDPSFNELNRHQVMHGESLDYGTEINSIKAISLLNYAVEVLQDAENKNNDSN